MPRLEFECKPPIPVDGDNVDDREPKPVIKLREGLSVKCPSFCFIRAKDVNKMYF